MGSQRVTPMAGAVGAPFFFAGQSARSAIRTFSVLLVALAAMSPCARSQGTDGLTIIQGGTQTGVTTRSLPLLFSVQTKANPTAGIAITFTVNPVAGAGGTFPGGASSFTVKTDPNGYAVPPLLVADDTSGTFNVTATDPTGGSVIFNISTSQCVSTPVVTSTSGDPALAGTLPFEVINACAGSTVTFASAVTGTISVADRMRIDNDLTIQGPGAGTLAIDGGNATRLFYVGGGNVKISGITLQNGLGGGGSHSCGGGAAGMGGALFVYDGSVTLDSVALAGNRAQGGSTVTAATDGNNPSGGTGFAGTAPSGGAGGNGGDLGGFGGIAGTAQPGGEGAGGAGFIPGVSGPITPASGGSGGFGGGGGAGVGAGRVSGVGGFGGGGGAGGSSIVDTTLAANASGGWGGGSGGPLTIALRTYTGVFPIGGGGAGFGGAVFVRGGSLALYAVTFTNNSAVGGSGGTNGQGKGGSLFIFDNTTSANVNSTVAVDFGSTYTGSTAPDAGLPAIGTTDPTFNRYTLGSFCPGVDTVDICGVVSEGTLQATAGTPQSVTVGAALSPLQATVQLPSTVPQTFLANVPVTFTTPATGASATFAGNVTSAIVPTDATGVASAPPLTANSTSGPYNITASIGTLQVSFAITNTAKQNQTITFNNPGNQVVGTAITLAATASSGLPVAFTSLTPLVCAVSAATANFVTGGACTIKASQDGNATFAAATPVTQSFSVSQASQTITFSNPGSQTVGQNLVLSASATSGLPVTFTSLTPLVCTVFGTTASFVSGGICTVQASQTGNTVYSAATPVTQSFSVFLPASFTITPNPSSETIKRGKIAALILQLKSVNGFSGIVKLSCSGGPAGSYCADFPMTVPLNGTANAVSGVYFPKNTAPGTYTVTFVGASGASTSTAAAKFTVTQ